MSEQKEDGRLKDGRMVLCAANKYKMKYFFNKNFDKIPQSMKEELHVISVLFAQEVGGIFKIVFEEDGDISIETEAEEDDLLYDDISAGLMVAEIKRTRQEMFESLSMFYKVFILQQDIETALSRARDCSVWRWSAPRRYIIKIKIQRSFCVFIRRRYRCLCSCLEVSRS